MGSRSVSRPRWKECLQTRVNTQGPGGSETLRRAALYATGDAKAGEALMAGLVERTQHNPADALAWFDAGYFVEASRQARAKNEPEFWSRFLEATGRTKTGYDAIAKAIELSKEDPAKNLLKNFGDHGKTLTDLRASVSSSARW